jgi:3-hydroxyisobutyrate dehydrogenase-like beta-hydroxyacid dehydrogenase
MKVGFIGMGIMGSRMAANLQNKGFDVVVNNRTRDKARSLLENGAEWADTPAEVAQRTDIFFTMLSTPNVVEQVALAKGGFLVNPPAGKLWVDSSTVNPAFSRRMAAEARARGVRFMDAPVAGSLKPAEDGALIFLAGGAKSDFQLCQPFFQAMGRQAMHVGENGMGSSMKLVINMLMGVEMAAFSEAVLFGQTLGIPREILFEALMSSPVTPPIMASKRVKIEGGDFSPEFPLRWMRKDMQLTADTAYEHGVSLPAVNAAKEVYALAERYGLGGEDLSAVYRFLKGNSDGK